MNRCYTLSQSWGIKKEERMRRKHIIQCWIIGIVIILFGIAIFLPVLSIEKEAGKVILSLLSLLFIFLGIMGIVNGYNLRLYNELLADKIKKETINNLLRESNSSMEQELTQIRDKKKLKQKN